MMAVDSLMEPHYNDLAESLRDKGDGEQYWVGIAGGPGSGKSTLAAAVAARLGDIAVVLPMDGFHYSRTELRAIGEAPGSPYSYEDLIARRGSEWTFDAAALEKCFVAAKATGQAQLPTYSRQLSDPVPGGVKLLPLHKIVLCEGNYLLNFDDPRWAGLRHLFAETWYIACPDLSKQRDRLIKRHLETWSEEKTRMWGPGEVGAAAKADANDVLNAQMIEAGSRKHADRIIISLG